MKDPRKRRALQPRASKPRCLFCPALRRQCAPLATASASGAEIVVIICQVPLQAGRIRLIQGPYN